MNLSQLLTALFFALPLSAKDTLFEAFESDGFGDWSVDGPAFGKSPVAASPVGMSGKVARYSEQYYVSSSHGGDLTVGTLTSPQFTVSQNFLSFLISGGAHPGKTSVQLFVNDTLEMQISGKNDLTMRPVVWDLSRFKGQQAYLRINDDSRKGWGIINADHFVFSDSKTVAFPETATLKKTAKGELVSTNTIAGVTVMPGTELTIFSENKTSDLSSPTALSVDEQGRVFVAETHRFRHGVEDNRDHLYWIMDDLASMTTADREAMHRKWAHKKMSVEKMTEKTEKIRVLVDTDGDGIADQHKVFADQFNHLLDGTAAGIMAFEGNIYFACIPKIWSLRDADGDLIADDYKTLQDGFGVRVSFSGHDLNGFALGPDGRIYTTIGDRGFSFTTKEGRQYSFPGQGAILRFEPDGSEMEVVHTGLRNPKEIAFDKWGTAVSVDNNSDQGDKARVVIMMDGADSGWRMGHQILHSFHRSAGIPERPVNQWMQEKMWEPYNASQPAYLLPPIENLSSGPSGLAYHPGTGYQLGCRDQFLICDYRGGPAASGIWRFGIQPDGAGFIVSESAQFNWGAGVTDVEWGYDGKIYVADFITGWTAHEAGRVYTLSQPGLAEDPTVQEVTSLFKKGFANLEAQQLSQLLGHPDQRVRLRAQYHLAKRPQALALFTAAANQRLNEMKRLHGAWGLGMLARTQRSLAATNFLARLLTHKDVHLRGQVVQALGEAPLKDSSILIPLLRDSSTRVQALTALALGRRPHRSAVAPLVEILIQNNDTDPYLRHAAVMGLIGSAGPNGLAQLLKHDHPSVRLAAVVGLRRFHDDRLVLVLNDPDPKISDEVIRAIHDTSIETVRPALAALLDNYLPSGSGRDLTPMMMRRLIHSAYRIGGEKNMVRLIKLAAYQKVPLRERQEILRLLSSWADPYPVDHSLGKFHPLAKRDLATVKARLKQHLPLLAMAEGRILGKAMMVALQYGINIDTLDTGTLTTLVRNSDVGGPTRAAALSSLLKLQPDNANDILTEAAQDKNDLLASTALQLAVARDPASSVAALKGALQSDSYARRQSAWNIAGTLPAEHAVPLIRDGLIKLTSGKGDLQSALELLAAARSREEPVIKTTLQNYQDSLNLDSFLDRWATTFSGGDADRGFKIFQSHGAAQCMRCHRYSDGHSEGGNAGPNLAGIALRDDAKSLVESLIYPHAKIARGFGNTTLTFKNGEEKIGMVLKEDKKHLELREGDTIWKIARQDIIKTTLATSPMPSMEGILQPREIRDLVAWLLTLSKESVETSPAYETVGLILQKGTPKTSSKPQPTQNTMSTENAIDPAIMELGKSLYDKPGSCTTCHQPTGAGLTGAFPPLAESDWVSGPIENLVRVQLHGLQGEIQVNGATYNGMMMPVQDAVFPQTDENIAAVLTYVRNAFGNEAAAVTPDMVASVRAEGRTTPLTMADVVDLTGPDRLLQQFAAKNENAGPPVLAEIPSSGLGASVWGIAAFLIILGLSVAACVGMKAKSS